jgi:hypothetical protein
LVVPGTLVNFSVAVSGVVVVVTVVGVVVVVVVAGQLGPLPGAGQASQQLVHVPAIPLWDAHTVAFFVLHFVTPLAFVRQQVTKFGFPQTDLAAHFLTAPLHVFGRKFGFEGARAARRLATAAAQATYRPWVTDGGSV